MGKALGRHSPDPGRQPGSGKQTVLRTGFSQQLQTLLWSALCGYFVAHPAGTFICIYSSWLTCHSPSSNVSIQGTIIYRIIDSPAPYRLQVTSPPLLSPLGTRTSCLAVHSCRSSLKEGRSPCPLVLSTSGSFCPVGHLLYISSPFRPI
jgi:hypothetical protein